MLRLEGLIKRFGTAVAVRNVSLDIAPGQMVGIIGRSGAGKSTLLRLINRESNTRSATILGVVGAGGIGLHLADRIRVNNWDEVSFILIMILVTVTGIDLVSKAIRWRFIQAGTSVAQRQHQEA